MRSMYRDAKKRIINRLVVADLKRIAKQSAAKKARKVTRRNRK